MKVGQPHSNVGEPISALDTGLPVHLDLHGAPAAALQRRPPKIPLNNFTDLSIDGGHFPELWTQLEDLRASADQSTNHLL